MLHVIPNQKTLGELRIFSDGSSRPTPKDDIFVYIVDMPVNEAVCPCEPFGYSVYINARLSSEGRERAYRHALKHIENRDFERDDVQDIEAKAHKRGGKNGTI